MLLVDDDPSALSLLRMLFEQNGYRVIVAANGVEAIEAHETEGPADLIITDIDMPGMDGLEMCRWLEGVGFCPRVIIVSGLEVDPADICAAAAPVEAVFAKPFRTTDLLETASSILPS